MVRLRRGSQEQLVEAIATLIFMKVNSDLSYLKQPIAGFQFTQAFEKWHETDLLPRHHP